MITHCPHCHTEYMLEDIDMPPGGMSMQCAFCKQVFGVIAFVGQGAGAESGSKPPSNSAASEAAVAREVEVTPAPGQAPGPPPPPPWQLKRESGEIVPVENLDIVKQWIIDKQVRREDWLTQDGIAWQRLANMRELIPSFEHARRPEATQLVQRKAFVASPSIAQGSDSSSPGVAPAEVASPRPAPVQHKLRPERMTAVDTWPGSSAPLVTAEPTRQASTTYTHDKEHPFATPISHVHRDYPAMWRRRRWFAWFLGSMAALTVIVGLCVWTAPQWPRRLIGAFYRETVPEAAVALVHQGYGQLYPDTIASLQAAIQTFKSATAEASSYAEAHAGLAEAALTLAEVFQQQAQDKSRSADKKHGHGREAEQAADLEKQAGTYLQMGTLEAQKAIHLAPDSMAANRAMALSFEVEGSELPRAVPYLRQARAAAPDDARVMYVALNAGEVPPARAMEVYRSIVERMPQFNRARYKLARLYMQENDLEHAREQVHAIIASAPDHNLARWLLGDAPAAAPPAGAGPSSSPVRGHTERASGHDAAPVVAQPPPNASYEVLTHQGQLLRATHQLPAAIALYERAIARDKRRATAYVGLGWCQLDQEQSAAAVSNFTHATELSPWSVEAHYGLAEALRASGDVPQAIKHYRQVLVIEPEGAMGHLARQVLDEISR